MTLIKTADRIINLDNVSQISNQSTENNTKVVLTFNHLDPTTKGLYKVTMSGSEASAFMNLFRSSELVRAAISQEEIDKSRNEKQEEGKKIASAFGKSTTERRGKRLKESQTKQDVSSFGQMGKRKLAL